MIPNPLLPGAKSTYHGWPIRWTGDAWLYIDNNTPIPGWGGENRPCKKCGATCPNATSDFCLGNLPGVDNACCGHGDPTNAYIRFTNGVAVEGFTITCGPGKPIADKEGA